MSLSVSALILCHNRHEEVQEAVASLDSGFDEVIVLDNASEPALGPVPNARLLRSDTNTGVSGGRNRLLAESSTDLAVFLDDDAVAIGTISDKVREVFEQDPQLAVVAFKITRPDGPVKHEYPFRGSIDDIDTPRDCAYFVGAGYAVRKSAVDAVGGLDDELFYGTEEIDLSMSLQREGWKLRYVPALAVEHRPSTLGRTVAPQVPAMLVRNRIVFARRHLMLPAALVHGVTWTARTLPDAVGSGGMREWLGALRTGLRRPIQRRPLTWAQHRKIQSLGGRIWY